MNISTLQMLVLMAAGVAIIVGITVATTSKSRLVKAGSYVFNAILLIVVAAAVFLTPTEDADDALGRNMAGLLLVAAAGWAGLTATRAYLRK
jgi:4-amino-4-deoxy-L-arabinose transferase-like glycosyltransferase